MKKGDKIIFKLLGMNLNTGMWEKGVFKEDTLENHKLDIHLEIDRMFDGIMEMTDGHICSVGLMVTPSIKIIHDDENLNQSYKDEFEKNKK